MEVDVVLIGAVPQVGHRIAQGRTAHGRGFFSRAELVGHRVDTVESSRVVYGQGPPRVGVS